MNRFTNGLAAAARVWALAWSLACAGGMAQAAEGLRAEVARPLQAAQEALRAGQGAEALRHVAEAAAVPQLNPQERYLIDRMQGPAAALSGDHVAALQAFERALGAGRASASERLGLWQAMVFSAQGARDAAAVARAARSYLAEGGTDPRLSLALAQALASLQDHAGMVQALQAVVAADDAAGRSPAEEVLKLLAAGQLRLGAADAYRATLERLVQRTQRPAYWADLLARLQAQPDFPPRLQIDALRLAHRVGALTERAELLNLVDLAQQAGQPAEALAVLDEGLGTGVLGTGPAAEPDQRRRQALVKAVAADRAQLPAAEAAARRAADGQPLLAAGLAWTFLGQTEQGLALMADGMAKGVARQPDEARLRWGEALWQAGHREAALAAWAPLAGQAGAAAQLARLWAWAP